MYPLSYDPVAVYQLSQQRAARAELGAEADRHRQEARAAARRTSPAGRRRPSRWWAGAVVRRLRLAH